MASTAIGMRWKRADENFRKQIDTLKVAMGCRSLARVANEAGLVPSTLYSHYNAPGKISRREERQLSSVFERYGLKYDPTWGEGASA